MLKLRLRPELSESQGQYRDWNYINIKGRYSLYEVNLFLRLSLDIVIVIESNIISFYSYQNLLYIINNYIIITIL